MVIGREDRVGVRSLGRFAADYRARGCPVGKTVDSESKENEPWRRITGITVQQEGFMDRKERRAGIRDLIDWIERWVKDCQKSEVKGQKSAAGIGAVGHGCPRARTSAESAESESAWACEGQAREVVAGVCLELNISLWKLSELVREYRGISATELIDGFRVKPVKAAVAELLKVYARELWLFPGVYVNVLISDERLKVYGGGKSEYFVDPTEDFHRRELAETKEDRCDVLLARFDAGWKLGGISRDGFAVGLGFRSFAEMNRACLNVHGKTVRQIAWDVIDEMMDFYLAKELEELRGLAVLDCTSPGIARARYLYCGSTRAPEGDLARISFIWDAMDRSFRDGMERWLGSA